MTLTTEERQLIKYVAQGGCVDIHALRRARETALVNSKNPNEFIKLFVSIYMKETDPHGDEYMSDL